MPINSDAVAEFSERGFTIVRGVYTPEEVERISAWLEELQNSDGSENDIATYFEASPITGQPVLVRAEYLLGDHNPEMTQLFLKDEVIAGLTAFLGDKPVLFKEKAN